MNQIRSDASEVYKLAADLSLVNAKSVPVIRSAMEGVGEGLAARWAANARETSGQHGKWYPDSIDSELAFDVGGVSVDVGPNRAKKQGSMGKGFEFGSKNQPPHLDGLRALDGAQVQAERVIDAAVGFLFG